MKDIEQKALDMFREKAAAKHAEWLEKLTMADVIEACLMGDYVGEAEEVCKWFEKQTGLSVMFYMPADMGGHEPVGRAN